jgi:hypothetical protein
VKNRFQNSHFKCNLQRYTAVRLNQVRRVHGEREALKTLAGASPFVVKLVHCFRDVHSMYMLLELVDGGALSLAHNRPPILAASSQLF